MRINQAIDYIHKNLEKNLTVEEIADYCCFSKFYFNRMFKAVLKESVYSFIKRRKLEIAAFLLRTNISMPITEIALRVGYSPSNFASAFREYYDVSASAYRRNNNIPVKDSLTRITRHIEKMKKKGDSFEIVNNNISIRKIKKMYLLYERFIGNYYDLAEFWLDFCSKMEKASLINENTKFIGVSYDDPFIVDENNCIYDICISVEQFNASNIHILEEGFYACYHFNDRIANMGKAFNELFSIWLPYSGYKTEHRLPLEIYHSQMDSQGRIEADLCIPVSNP